MDNFNSKSGSGNFNKYGEGNYIKGMPAVHTQKFHDFSGGFDAREPAEDVDIKGSPYSINVDVDRQDRLFRVPGTSLLEAMAGHAPDQLIIHAGLDLRSELVIIDTPNVGIKREVATVWSNIGLLPGPYYYCSYGPTLLFSNGQGQVLKHEAGAATVEVTKVTQGSDMCVFAGRVYVGGAVVGGATQPMGMDWSGPLNYDDHVSGFGAGQELLLDDQASGDRIVATRAMNLDLMAILCRYGVWTGVKTGDPLRPADFSPKVKGLGCAVRETARQTYAGVLYLSDEGICLFDGNNSVIISPQINDLLLPIDVTKLKQYRATYNPQTQQYILFTPTFTFILDVVRGRWHRRTMTPKDGVPFPQQFHASQWGELVGSWGALVGTWKDMAPAENQKMRMIFLGADIHQEDSTSLTQFGAAVQGLWGTKKLEAPQNDRLVLTKWARMRYTGSGTVRLYLSDFNREYAVSGADIILSPSANPRLAKAGRNFTGLGLGMQLELLKLETKIHSLELDWLPRGPRLSNDVGIPAPIIIPPDLGLLDVAMWARPIRANQSGENFIGQAFHDSVDNNLGGAALAVGWIAALKRYGHRSAASQYFSVTNWQTHIGITPGQLVDPSTPVRPIILRVRDVVQFNKDTGVAGGNGFFGLVPAIRQNFSIVSVIPRIVGFAVLGTTWATRFTTNNGNVVRNIDTAILAANVHELMFELDGVKKEVRWYIDNVLVDTYVVAADVTAVPVGIDTSSIYLMHMAGSPAVGTTVSMYHGLGVGPIIEIQRTS